MSHETYSEITAILGDDLKQLVRKAQSKWPSLDAELLLVNWLCYRNGIDPPPHAIIKRPWKQPQPAVGSGVKTTWAEELALRPLLPEVSVAVPPPAPATPRAPGLRSGSRPGSAVRIARPASGGGHCDSKRSELTPSTRCASSLSSPEHPLPEPRLVVPRFGAQTAPEGRSPESIVHKPISAISAAETRLPEPWAPAPRSASALSTADTLGTGRSMGTTHSLSPQPVEPVLKTLTGLSHKVDADSARHFGRSDLLTRRTATHFDAAMDRRLEQRRAFLERVPLFSLDVLSREEQNALTRCLRSTTFGRHECILAEGEANDRMIIIERGECDAVRGGDVVGQPCQGSFFGEASIVFDVHSKLALVAASEVGALWLTREDVAGVVKGAGLHRMRAAARAQLCADVPVLAGLTHAQQVRIAERMRSERWRKGSTLAGPMHASSRLFIIEEGEARVQEKDHRGLLTSSMHSMQSNQHLQANLLKAGQFFGMEGLLSGSEMGCSVLAISEEVRTLSISYDEILASCEPEDGKAVATQMHSSMQVFLLRQVPQLRSLSEEAFNAVRAQAQEVLFRPWTAIVPKGTLLDTVFVLKSGKVAEHEGDLTGLQDLSRLEVHRPESVTPGDCFWSWGLVDANARAKTTLVALTHASLLKLERQAVTAVLHEMWEKADKVPLFSSSVLTKPHQMAVVSRLRAWRFAPGRTVVVEGELGERLFIVEAGVCDIIRVANGKEKTAGQLGRGACFGELSLFFDEPRKMTVRSVTEVTLLTLSRQDLAAALPPAKVQRVRTVALSLCLKSIPLMSRLDSELRLRVAERFQSKTWKAGEVITRRLLPCQSLYFVESGTCLAAREETSRGSRLVHLLGETELPVVMRQDEATTMLLGPGQYFGMRGLLAAAPLGLAVWAESAQVRTSSVTSEDLLLAAGPERRPELESLLREALRLHFLRQLPPLEDLAAEQLLAVVLSRCQELAFEEGEVIVSRGAPVEAFLILEQGEVLEHPAAPRDAREMWWEGYDHQSPGACFPPGAAYREAASGCQVCNFTLLAKTSCRLLRVPLAALSLPPPRP